MKHLLNISILLLLSVCFFYPTSSIYSQNSTLDNIVAIVEDHKISINTFSDRYLNYLNATGIKDQLSTRKAILNNMINETLLLKYDDNTSILNNRNYLSEIVWAKKQAALAYLKNQEIYAKITITDAELRQAFERANEKLAARHLYTETEEEAYNLYQLLQVGIDFNFLAKQVFTDSVLRNNGGYLGYFSWGDMDPAFEDAAYTLNIGEVSPPVKTAYGYSIIKL
ncbi:MAG: peptidylprolyl isomerase, partial [Ignavibacteriales bacterium]|nr:peptidylprolyl isomerase [Ignavibacteriales bacterium]